MNALAANVLVSLVAFIVGYAIGRRPPYLFQNPSEATLSSALRKYFAPPDFHLLNHLTLRTSDGTTQIDHVLVTRFGVYVIETKDYGGWIFANAADRYWTQVLFRAKFRFRNPIRQNYKHLCAVRDLLDFLPPQDIISAVVFSDRAEFRTPVPDGVYCVTDFLSHLESRKMGVMSINRMQLCVGRLETARLAISRLTDVEHAQQLQNRFGADDY